jgi:hypothetical protein
MPEIVFPSRWLKANVNVRQGDTITFLNAGEFDKKQEQWVFKVRVARTGEEKLFGLNKKNFTAISNLYGKNSDEWIDKQMGIRVVTVESPKGGEVDAIRLHDPARDVTDPDIEVEKEDDSDAPVIPF